jgi:hypothetical protein
VVSVVLSDAACCVRLTSNCITTTAYPFREQADMNFTYGRDASRLCQETFPDRNQPNHESFAAVYRRLAETGTLAPVTVALGRPRVARTPDLEEHIVERVAGDPGGTRQLAAVFPVGHMAVWRVLHEQLLYAYHSQRVQGLTPADYPPRENC